MKFPRSLSSQLSDSPDQYDQNACSRFQRQGFIQNVGAALCRSILGIGGFQMPLSGYRTELCWRACWDGLTNADGDGNASAFIVLNDDVLHVQGL